MNEVSPSRISQETAEAQQGRFKTVMEGQESVVGEVPSDTELFKQWESLTPPKGYSGLSVRETEPGFVDDFKAALKAGEVEDFLTARLGEKAEYNAIYPARAVYTGETTEAPADLEMFQKNFMSDVLEKVAGFETALVEAGLPPAYLEEYKNKIGLLRKTVETVGLLGTPELTEKYASQRSWQGTLDVEASFAAGKAVLPYEEQAKAMLERSKQLPEDEEITMDEALETWQLSVEEESYVHEGTESAGVGASADQTKRLFEVLFNRLGILGESGWKVEISEKKKSITVNAKARILLVPAGLDMSPSKLKYILAHEMVHVIRSENGAKQGCELLRLGMSDYLEAEEGVATIAELGRGEPFGHVRQKTFAARYLATAMALKAHVDEGGRVIADHSTQEIYDTLIDYGVNETEASAIVWRIFRGTSLKHEGLYLPIETEEGVRQLPIAECYAKDTVYLRGMLQIHAWLKEVMPVYAGAQLKLTKEASDFSMRTLARLGYAWERLEGKTPSWKWSNVEALRQHYQELAELGRKALMKLMDYLVPGKMSLEAMLDPDSEWRSLVRRGRENGLVAFEKILEPANNLEMLEQLRVQE